MRDSQRQKVYDAEQAWGSFSKGGQYVTVDECQMMVDAVWSNKRVQDAFPEIVGRRAPRVHDGRGRRRAGGNRHGLWMPRWSRWGAVLLHELAHAIDDITPGLTDHRQNRPWHGPVFCQIFLELVRIEMGFEESMALFRSMRKHRVKVRGK